jgi:hypothetical protein
VIINLRLDYLVGLHILYLCAINFAASLLLAAARSIERIACFDLLYQQIGQRVEYVLYTREIQGIREEVFHLLERRIPCNIRYVIFLDGHIWATAQTTRDRYDVTISEMFAPTVSTSTLNCPFDAPLS